MSNSEELSMAEEVLAEQYRDSVRIAAEGLTTHLGLSREVSDAFMSAVELRSTGEKTQLLLQDIRPN